VVIFGLTRRFDNDLVLRSIQNHRAVDRRWES
jgi:hypothetical protein